MKRLAGVASAVLLLVASGCDEHDAAEKSKTPVAPQPSPVETLFIKGGTFTMGTAVKDKKSDEYHEDERPMKVAVNDFRIGKTPITAAQFCAFLNDKEVKINRNELYRLDKEGSRFKLSTIAVKDGVYVPRQDADNAPANCVRWLGAVEYCKWLSAKNKSTYRLPSEAEWEYAARGKEGRLWPWGSEEPTDTSGYRYDRTRKLRETETWDKTSVGSYPAGQTPDGVQDMLGYFIGEWCVNIYNKQPTDTEVTHTAVDTNDLSKPRVVRGAFHRRREYHLGFPGETLWHDGRVWTRVGEDPESAPGRAACYGFRVVEEVPPSQ